jgi:hypothetical protein
LSWFSRSSMGCSNSNPGGVDSIFIVMIAKVDLVV